MPDLIRKLPLDVEDAIFALLSFGNWKGALIVARQYDPAWGLGVPGDMFALPFDESLLSWAMGANPPHIKQFNERVGQHIRAVAGMQYFLGGERGLGGFGPSLGGSQIDGAT